MFIVVLLAALLIAITSLIHYEALSLLSRWLPRSALPRRALVLAGLLGLFVAHAVEIGLYGLSYALLARWEGHGGLGLELTGFDTALYFSAETYTSLGFGDVAPVGPMRLLAGVEALNGLLLIAWSASFMYLEMERHWRPR
jgi:Ion channel